MIRRTRSLRVPRPQAHRRLVYAQPIGAVPVSRDHDLMARMQSPAYLSTRAMISTNATLRMALPSAA